VDDFYCHVQFDEQFDAKNTFVYDCLEKEEPEKNPNIWLCVSCHKCEESCPYEVSPTNFIEAIKEKAFSEGHVHPTITGEVEQVLSIGFAFPLTRNAENAREKLDLGPLKTDASELRRIAEATGLVSKLKDMEGDEE
jgi:heterodisulfide reductase subunit C